MSTLIGTANVDSFASSAQTAPSSSNVNFIQKFLSRIRSRASARRDQKARPEMTAFKRAAAELKPGDVAVDCGANIGLYTVLLAQTGAEVYAFEPNPAAYAALVKATAEFSNVRALHAALTDVASPIKLFLHKWDEADPLYWSTGSSILDSKRNVSKDNFIMVEGIPLAKFIRDLGGRKIRLLKMDIEGAEIAVLNHLLDEGLQSFITEAFIEIHDKRVPELVEPMRKLRARFAAAGWQVTDLNAKHLRLSWA